MNGYFCGKITKDIVNKNPNIILSKPDTSKRIYSIVEINYKGFNKIVTATGDSLSKTQLRLINELKRGCGFKIEIYLIYDNDTTQLNSLFFEMSNGNPKRIPCLTDVSATIDGLCNLELNRKEINKLKIIFGRLEKHKKDGKIFYVEKATDVNLALDLDRKSTRLNSSHIPLSRMPSSA